MKDGARDLGENWPDWLVAELLVKEAASPDLSSTTLPLRDAVFALSPGGFSPVIETDSHLFILRGQGRRPRGVQPLSPMAEQIRAPLERQKRNAAVDGCSSRFVVTRRSSGLRGRPNDRTADLNQNNHERRT